MNSKRLLILAAVWPEPTSSAAGVRMRDVIRVAKRASWQISFASPSKVSEFRDSLEQSGVRTLSCAINDSRFDSELKEIDPHVVLFDRFMLEEQFGWRVEKACPQALRVLDTIDLHFLRRARTRAVQAGKDPWQLPELLGEDAHREIASIFRSDLSLICSDFEMELLLNEFKVPKQILSLSRFFYQDPPLEVPDFEARKNFCMIGNFRHPPNWDAVQWLAREIWPEIRSRLPEAEVHVYGAYPPREAMAMDNPAKGFRVLGPAIDACETLARYRVNLAPLRFGAGIKGKILDGWWSGTPVVTTPSGAEGMGIDLGSFGSSRTAREVADRAQQLYESSAQWKEAQLIGRKALRLHSESENHEKLCSEWEALLPGLEIHRQRNFIGSMLRHHTLRSTEYFSRWIELKEVAQGNGLSLK